ncbi:polynucleotide kinase domain protein [Bacteriovorax sp. BSW11_IV]|uniref:phosphatase domain-containing protein n=1 Tax=Bacteriovorax sp. BSW11_IV TaxID=1353529 RepID=UPI00038A4BD0|nr:HAD family acid phosphatase [Bacteriovorax sp. BSW11_IV]EQC48887.1 polynucleotide kinase domain protein [Bacteriovorax sp. BSW11_IV]
MERAIIVDLDGTLCDCEHRVHHVNGEGKKNWKEFNELMGEDKLNKWCLDLIHAMAGTGHKILFVTGREDQYRAKTKEWLARHYVPYDELHMRSTGDFREDSDIKKDIFQQDLSKRYEVTFVVDDRKSVVTMWREIGLVCLQCDWGDF